MVSTPSSATFGQLFSDWLTASACGAPSGTPLSAKFPARGPIGFGPLSAAGMFLGGAQMGSQMGSQMGPQAGSQMGSQFGSQFGNQFGSQVGIAMSPVFDPYIRASQTPTRAILENQLPSLQFNGNRPIPQTPVVFLPGFFPVAPSDQSCTPLAYLMAGTPNTPIPRTPISQNAAIIIAPAQVMGQPMVKPEPASFNKPIERPQLPTLAWEVPKKRGKARTSPTTKRVCLDAQETAPKALPRVAEEPVKPVSWPIETEKESTIEASAPLEPEIKTEEPTLPEIKIEVFSPRQELGAGEQEDEEAPDLEPTDPLVSSLPSSPIESPGPTIKKVTKRRAQKKATKVPGKRGAKPEPNCYLNGNNPIDDRVDENLVKAAKELDPRQLPNGRFECPECLRTFKHCKHVRRHFVSHTLARPFSCIHCNMQFRRKDTCKRHQGRCLTMAKKARAGTSKRAHVTTTVETTVASPVSLTDYMYPYGAACMGSPESMALSHASSRSVTPELLMPVAQYSHTIDSPRSISAPPTIYGDQAEEELGVPLYSQVLRRSHTPLSLFREWPYNKLY